MDMSECVIGIDIGGTNTVVGIVDRTGTILTTESMKTRGYATFDAYVEDLDILIARMIKEHPEHTIKGVGMGAPDANHYTGRIEHAANLEWKGIIDVVDKVKAAIKLPVSLTNDANAAALGEMLFGGARGMKNFVEFTLGTGIGTGIVIDGEMVYGHTSLGGEIGHTVLVPEGRDCGCGRRGCMETYISATGICRTAQEVLCNRMDDSELRAIAPKDLTSKKIYDAAEHGDKLALECFDITAKWLGQSIADTVAISSPEAIFLFGGLANAGEMLMKPFRKYFDHYCMEMFKGTVKIERSHLNESDAAILGAAALIWDELEKEA